MLAQENVISNMEMRTGFSLYCVHMETQLVHLHLEVLASILNTMVGCQIRAHNEVSFCFLFIYFLSEISTKYISLVGRYLETNSTNC